MKRKRYFERQEGDTNKLWQIEQIEGVGFYSLRIQYKHLNNRNHRILCIHIETVEFDSLTELNKHYENRVQEKIDEGYTEKGVTKLNIRARIPRCGYRTIEWD